MADLNKLTNTGIHLINIAMKTGMTSTGIPCFVGWGIGTTPAAATDTGLETPATESRTNGTETQQTTTTTKDTVQVIAVITCNATGKSISEVGLFNNATGGTCFMRSTFTPIAVVEDDTITFTLKMVFTRGA